MNSNVGWDQRVEPKLLYGDAELGQLTLVGLNHVGMGLADLLKRRLDLSDGVRLEVLDFLESRSNDTECLGLNTSSSQQLVDLCIFGLQTLLDGLVLLLEDQVADARLLMDLVSESVELVEEHFLLLDKVLTLLEAHLVLPLDLASALVIEDDLLLALGQLGHDLVMVLSLLLELLNQPLVLLERLGDVVVLLLLSESLLLPVLVGLEHAIEVIRQLPDHVQVGVRYIRVVGFNLLIFLLVLMSQLIDGSVLLLLDLLDGGTSLLDLLLAQQPHLVLVLEVDLVADAFELVADLRLLLVLLAGQGVQILLVTDLLLLLGDVDGPEVLLQLSLVDAVLILDVLEGDLRLFLELSELIEVL